MEPRIPTAIRASTWASLLAGGLLAVAAAPALAHHVPGDATPRTTVEGFLMGFTHPVIGLDHLALLLAVGILLSRFERLSARATVGLGFVAATLAGAVLHLRGMPLPGGETWIALSLVVGGLAAVLPGGGRSGVAAALVAIAGLAHSWGHGESLLGAEPAQVGAYLAGFAAVESGLILGLAAGALALGRRLGRPPARLLQATGAAVSLTGLVGLVERAW